MTEEFSSDSSESQIEELACCSSHPAPDYASYQKRSDDMSENNAERELDGIDFNEFEVDIHYSLTMTMMFTIEE